VRRVPGNRHSYRDKFSPPHFTNTSKKGAKKQGFETLSSKKENPAPCKEVGAAPHFEKFGANA
jgi:hypothetical protein